MRLLLFAILLISPASVWAATPIVGQMPNASVVAGTTYTATPTLAAGENVRWVKEYGPDDMTVDPVTGVVSWTIPAGTPGEAFHLGVKATNSDGSGQMTWVLKVGSGNYLYVGPADTYKTISAATAAAASGDTIVVRDGTYTGAANAISNFSGGRGTLPPSGTASQYSTVMAEHPGRVILDGGGARTMIGVNGNYSARDVGTQGYSYDARYLAFKGFIAKGSIGSDPHISEIHLMHAQYVKLIDCGAEGTTGPTAPISVFYSNYVTVEGCYMWGLGRMGVVFYKSDYNIVRRSVARIDRTTMVNPFGGGFDLYACQHTRVQNCIVVDLDRKAYYANYTNIEGVFIDSSGSSSTVPHLDNVFRRCLALNADNVITTTQANVGDVPTFDNIVAWDMRTLPNSSATPTYSVSFIGGSDDISISQSTIGDLSSPYAPIYTHDPAPTGGTAIAFTGWNGVQSITNSIIDGVTDFGGGLAALFYDFETVDHNNIHGTGAVVSHGASDTNTLNGDTKTACLKYLPRVEAGCTLQTAGVSGARVGADLSFMVGKSGTLFGEYGFDSDTAQKMWPFPHETDIKTSMSAYVFDGGNLTGDRGFASTTAKRLDGVSPVTLTSYVWEYLGNPIPSDIYGGTTPVASPLLAFPRVASDGTFAPKAAKYWKDGAWHYGLYRVAGGGEWYDFLEFVTENGDRLRLAP